MARVRFLGSKAQGSVRIGNNVGLVDAEVISIGDVLPGGTGKTYEWDTPDGVVAGNVAVVIGANAAASIVNLRDAINATPPVPGVTAFIDPKDTATLRIETDDNGSLGNLAFVETMTDGANVISGATLLNGESSLNQVAFRGTHIVTANDVSAGNIMISTGATTPRFKLVQVVTSVGANKAVDSLVTVSAGRLRLDFQGGTDPVAGDEVNWLIWE